jgi:hypothetical protein
MFYRHASLFMNDFIPELIVVLIVCGYLPTAEPVLYYWLHRYNGLLTRIWCQEAMVHHRDVKSGLVTTSGTWSGGRTWRPRYPVSGRREVV